MSNEQALADALVQTRGETAVLTTIVRRLIMLQISPNPEASQVWDRAIDADLETWRKSLEQGDGGNSRGVQAAIDLIARFKTADVARDD